MAKRFTDTEKWTKNKWFRKLPIEVKLFWLFILDHCDMVGVWEEDIEFFNETLKVEVDKEEVLKLLNGQVKVMPGGKKWWLVNFCNYQYGHLDETKTSNKPHQRYISELKKHRLWIDYTKTIHSLEEKEQEKEKDKEEEKEEEKERVEISKPKKEKIELVYPYDSPEFMGKWNLLLTQSKWKGKSKHALQAALLKLANVDEESAIQAIIDTIAGNYQGIFPKQLAIKKQPPDRIQELLNRINAPKNAAS